MSKHPVNLILRVLLEIILLFIFGLWGWHLQLWSLRIAGALLVPIVGAAVWAVFRVEGDPGKAIVPISGYARLLLECTLFAAACAMLYELQLIRFAMIFSCAGLFHYVLSFDRIVWLLWKKK